MAKSIRSRQPRPCFVVVSWEGCAFEKVCQQKHVMVDCEVHGLLARTETVDAAEFIMKGHIDTPSWPTPLEPLTEKCLDRIAASKVNPGRLFVPSSYKGS